VRCCFDPIDFGFHVVVLNPAQFRLLLAGPRVSRLLPFFSARGYVADACVRGSEALALLQQSPRHILLVELDLEDMLCGDLLILARQGNLAGAVLLLEDPAKTGLIVSTLVRGVDGYVATPPDEAYLFRVVERQLLAQWAIAQGAESARDTEERARLERQLQQERLKVTDLVKELGALRTEVGELKKQQRRSNVPEAIKKLPREQPLPHQPPDGEPNKKRGSSEAPWNAMTDEPKPSVNDARTAPRGYQPPPAGAFEEASDEHTRLGDPREKSQPPSSSKGKSVASSALKKSALEEDDLFLMLDDGTGSTKIDASANATDDDDLLNLDE
jgi:DNA-binding NarL/FixJ family response regulator